MIYKESLDKIRRHAQASEVEQSIRNIRDAAEEIHHMAENTGNQELIRLITTVMVEAGSLLQGVSGKKRW